MACSCLCIPSLHFNEINQSSVELQEVVRGRQLDCERKYGAMTRTVTDEIWFTENMSHSALQDFALSFTSSSFYILLQGQICLMEKISLKAVMPSISQLVYSSTAWPFFTAVLLHPLFDQLQPYGSHYFRFKPGEQDFFFFHIDECLLPCQATSFNVV